MVRRGFGNRSDAEVQRLMGKKCDKFFFLCVYIQCRVRTIGAYP